MPKLGRIRRVFDSFTGQATVGAVLLGVLLHLRYGYQAGARDHLVLSPVGMQWAHPDWFRNDWAVATATQPHWMFDILTWFGSATGTLAAVYLAYWLLALAVFGFGTAMLARAWAPRFPLLAVLTVIIVSVVMPVYLLGAGPILFPTAVPGVLGGALLFVCVGAMLTERWRLAAGASLATSLVHVQLGTVSAVLLFCLAGWIFVRNRRIDWTILGGALVSLLVVVVNLRLRPVVGDLNDFADACQTLIPYHCYAPSFKHADLRGWVALVGLAALTVLYLPRNKRHLGLIVILLPAFGLLAGTYVDRYQVPVLGVLAEGVNVYRLGQMVMPFTVWGLLTPVFANLTARARWVTLAVVLPLGDWALGTQLLGVAHLGGPGVQWMVVLAGALVVGVAGWTVPGLARTPERVVRAAVLAVVACVLISAYHAETFKVTPFDPRLFPQGDLAAWGELVQREVPSGAILVTPPVDDKLRMVTKRAIVADCKYGPYGGDPWHEYKARMDALGGFGQCFGAPNYGDLSGAAVAAAARTYGADYVLLRSDDAARLQALTDAAWQVRVRPLNQQGYVVLRAPWL